MSRELNRSNSDLVTVDLIASNTALSPIARMQLIAQVADDWRRAVGGMPATHGARRMLADRNHLGQRV